jgi:uncharacterized membrane protein (GlpM family)
MSPALAMLAIKLTLVPAIIYAVTLAGRRWGARVAGRLSAFPVVAGPILLFVAIEQGPAFAADAGAGTVAAIAAFAAYSLVYSWLATRFAWPASLAGAYAAYGLVAWLATQSTWSVATHVAIDVAVLVTCIRAMPRDLAAQPPPRAMRFDLPLRMVCGAALVLLITWLAESLGPRAAGVLALFPVLGTVLTVFSHRASGAAFVVVLLRGMLWGNFAMMSFCATLALLLPRVPLALAFAGAIAAALGANALTLRVQRGLQATADRR